MDGGVDRVCRGDTPEDNSMSYYLLYKEPALSSCRSRCLSMEGCKGVEYHAATRHCEVWTRPAGILATRPYAGGICLRRSDSAAPEKATTATVTTTALTTATGSVSSTVAESTTATGTTTSTTTSTTTTTTSTTTTVTETATETSTKETSTSTLTETKVPLLEFAPVDGGKNRACRGSSAVDNLSSHYLVYAEASLDACMMRCSITLGCVGVEYSAGRCEVWIRPEGIGSTVYKQGYACFRYLNGPTAFNLAPNPQGFTKYVVHFMPWFIGDLSQPAHDHWCASYGNSYYDSALGTYSLTHQVTVDAQLDMIKETGLDGIWIDYQTKRWDPVVESLIQGTKARGMGFAIVIDSAINRNIFADVGKKVAEWMSEPHYFRHFGNPIVPVFNDPDTVFTPLPSPAVYISRYEVAKPAWAQDTYPWINAQAVLDGEKYYREPHPAFATGSAYRGYRDCYPKKSLSPPHYGKLLPTLRVAARHRPAFVQLLTWNDFSEGTMLEPAWLRPADQCRPICGTSPSCDTCVHCLNGHTYPDCTKPIGAMYGPGDPICGATGNLSARADLDILQQHIAAQRATMLMA